MWVMAKETVESLCKKAKQALAGGDSEKARQLYLEALAVRAEAPDVHYGLATIYFLNNDLAQSAYHFKEVTRLDPLRAGAYINLGAVYNRMERLDEAIPLLRRGIQLDMNRAEGYYNLGLVYKRKGEPDLAIQAYREATRINPRMADAHYNLANLYLEREEFGMALTHYQSAVELRPNWEKARRGVEQAQAALNAASPFAGNLASDPDLAIKPQPPKIGAGEPSIDPQKLVDPAIHGGILSTLHRATIETDDQGRVFLQVLEDEVEQRIKDLSALLLHPNAGAVEIDNCIQKFEAAMNNMREQQADLARKVERVLNLGDKLDKA
jgi:Flp pilus assembly protein TadD